jgi:hypothetical protein
MKRDASEVQLICVYKGVELLFVLLMRLCYGNALRSDYRKTNILANSVDSAFKRTSCLMQNTRKSHPM